MTRRAAKTDAIRNPDRPKEASRTDWNFLYRAKRTPWVSSGPGPYVLDWLNRYGEGRRVVEVGCGDGRDALAFANAGFDVTALDCSREAVAIARCRLAAMSGSENSSSGLRYLVADFFRWRAVEKFNIAFDKGVFHNLAGQRRRTTFVRRVSEMLAGRGVWVSICGTADGHEPSVPHGAIFLSDIVTAVEPFFEVLEVRKDRYGLADPGQKDFQAWYCAFKRRMQ